MSNFTRAVVLAVLSLVLPCAMARGQDVKYEKYTLPNGLTVILHEDHALPVATINLWYYVGAKEEPARRSGFAHLFEHLMFMGTKRVPGSDFDNIMEAGGGSNNASTSLDRTNYFSSGPTELLPTLLWLDADRQEDLGRFMTKEKLDLQRDVVRNEIRQNVENTPYGRADDSMERLMYPATHPYFKGVYGTHEDLEAATVNDVRDFFANFYVPNNCSLVVAGDFDPAKIKPLIEKVFGSIPAGPKPNLRDSKDYLAPVLGRVVRSTMFDQVQLPRMTFVYHSPAHFAEGDAEMDLAGAVLAGGPSSRLYQRLVLKDKLAVEVSAYQASQTLSSLFFVTVMCAPDADLAAIERAVDEEVAKFVSEGPTADELSQHQAQTELGFLARLDSLAAKADAMNQYQYAFGEPNSFKRDLDRYRNATVSGVKEWAKRVLTPNSRAIVRVVPIDAEERAASGRDERPELAGAPAFTLTKPEEFTLANGIPVKLWQRKDLPLVAMEMQFHAGARKAAGAIVGPKESGVPSLLADMLDEGTKDLDSVGFAQAIESQGATFGAGADQESLTVSVSGIKRNFEKSLALCGEAICRPRLAAADFERVKRITLEDLNQSDADPQQVASRVATRMLFGDENPYAFSAGGTPASVEAATLEKVKQLHAALVVPANASIMIAGDLSASEAKQMLEKALAGWKGSDAKIAATAIPATQAGAEGLRVVVVERPEAVQTVIRFIMPAPDASDPSRNTLRAVNTILGGSFTSRLNRNLREEHGYTYGAGSRFMMEATTGYFIASSAVKAEVTGAALAEFFRELERTRGGDMDQDEVLKATRTLRTDTIESLAGLHGVISQAASLESLGLPYSTISTDMDQLSKLTAADLNSAAKTGIPLDRAVLVLVGDPTVVREALSQLQEGGRTLPAPKYVTPWGESTTPSAETQTAKGE